MSKRTKRFHAGYLMAIALCMVGMLAGTALAQGRMGRGGPGQAPDLLMPLKNALQNAGAAALSADQETKIKALIANFHSTNPPVTPSADVQAARLAYDKAILERNTAAIAAPISALVADQTNQASNKMMADAAFAIAVVQSLGSDQVTALENRMGSGGVVRMIEALVGGPGGMGMGRMMGNGAAALGVGRANPIKK